MIGVAKTLPVRQPLEMLPSDWTRRYIRLPIRGRLAPFSFRQREYLIEPYDCKYPRILFMIARQSEKTVVETAEILMASGQSKPIKDVEIGERVVSLAPGGSHLTTGAITWKSRRYRKKCIQLNTRQSHELIVGKTHPMRIWDGWLPAGAVQVGQRLAVIRHGGVFSCTSRKADDLFWDEVINIEQVGEQWCYDITVEGTSSFVANSFITHNSTTQGNRLLSLAGMIPHYKILYVSPSQTQTRKFSQDRISLPLIYSLDLRKELGPVQPDNVHQKGFRNHSSIELRYAGRSADRSRGIPADCLAIDEFQDIFIENVPVLEETLSHSDLPTHSGLRFYSFTPKSLDNTGSAFWDRSTQTELAIPCEHHGLPNVPGTWHWNIIGEQHIGKEGLICDKCGKLLNRFHPLRGWVDTVPGAPYKGYRLPQVLVPTIRDDQWYDKVILKYEGPSSYPRAEFFNEVLALPYESGIRPLTKGELMRCCDPNWSMGVEQMREARKWHGQREIFAGIDYGSGEHSWTVIALGTYLKPDIFKIFYLHRFTGRESSPEAQGHLITQLLRLYNVKISFGDYGLGYHINDILTRTFGVRKHHILQYVAEAKRKIYYNRTKVRWIGVRDDLLAAWVNAIKNGKIEFPSWSSFETYGQDFLNITTEFNGARQRTVFSHHPKKPDDSAHACLYCLLAASLVRPRPDIFLSIEKSQDYSGQ